MNKSLLITLSLFSSSCVIVTQTNSSSPPIFSPISPNSPATETAVTTHAHHVAQQRQLYDADTLIPTLQEMRQCQVKCFMQIPHEEYDKLSQIIEMRMRLEHTDQHCTRSFCPPKTHDHEQQSHCEECKKHHHCRICIKYPQQDHLRTIISVFWKRHQAQFPQQ